MLFSRLNIGQHFRRDVTGAIFIKVQTCYVIPGNDDSRFNALEFDDDYQSSRRWWLPDNDDVVVETFARSIKLKPKQYHRTDPVEDYEGWNSDQVGW